MQVAEDAWLVACRSEELASVPLGRTLGETRIVLFRDASGAARALLDRCAHREVPLSCGRVVDGQLECILHGWRYDGAGRCLYPERLVPSELPRPSVQAFATRERDGLIWVQI